TTLFRSPGHEDQPQLRRVVRSRDADPAGRAGRRVRLGRSVEHGQGRRRARQRGRADRLRQEQARDRRGAGKPEAHRDARGSRKPGVVVVLCDPTVPCGKFADQVLANAKVTVTPKSREVNVKATLSKVEVGEADAAIVYVTDVKGSGKVEGVPIPDAV